jgi:uncharacterized damage-inducible protein DinB
MKNWMKQQLEYHQWANKRLLGHMETLPAAIWDRQIQSVFPTIRETFVHILEVDRLWYKRLAGHDELQRTEEVLYRPEDVKQAFEQIFHKLMEYVESLETMDVLVEYRNSKGETFRNQACEVIQHLVNHGTYHRGNISSMLKEMGQKGISTDFIFYLRENEKRG